MITPGKYEAKVQTRGVRENTRLEGQPLEAYATFTLEGERIYWNGLLLTRDGGRNSKTMKCIQAMGCEGEDVIGWLNKPVPEAAVQLTIVEKPNKAGEMKLIVDWVNKIGGEGAGDQVLEKLKAAGLGGPADEFGF